MRALSGLNKAFGYALSMLLLAVASLVVIPAMIRASGDAAWGAIAVGQSVGAIAAVAVAYGWSLSGPAEVARGSADQRREEFVSSVKVRLSLFVPVVLVAVLVSMLLAPARPDLATLGSATASLAGLTANWFFVGLARPYVFLLVETVPRVVGTLVGILLMRHGADAGLGLACQSAGFLVAFCLSSVWIFAYLRRSGAVPAVVPGLGPLLRSRGDGLVSALGSAGYVAAPVIIVSAVAPAVQPLYALADKLQRQVSVAMGPAVTVLQGWVPRGRHSASRARRGLAGSAGIAVLMALAVWVAGRPLLGWLGAGSLEPSGVLVVLMAVFVALNFMESVIAKTVLATFGKLRAVARATLVGALVGLPLVAAGAVWWGAEGALVGVVLGLAVRMGWELVVALRVLRGAGTEEL
ncbi:lipopolysaccharide biosynthesis protein [Tessaracoccus palaemonis]|uniref:O-antigen/teichoic acid export membrane protein n=1 Tax=Tessaracoccus palaemonis TaxID=2829499 RepID=A0ABX8SKK9_9ACTN|nr:hypothetical protein [Tessaracoccus palaemonis]QXT63424.1 hypothetical protein KDB89_02775 [Tessaracoccus palaemonis]